MNPAPSDHDEFLEALGFEPVPYLRAGESPAPSKLDQASPARALKLVHFVGEELLPQDGAHSEAQELLQKMLGAMKLKAGDFFVSPTPSSREDLIEILKENPARCVVLFGSASTQLYFGNGITVQDKRAELHTAQDIAAQTGESTSLVCTHHPSLCLTNPALKKPVWEDLQRVMEFLGLKS